MDFDDDYGYSDEPWDGDDSAADAEALASAVFGTDEDYIGYEAYLVDEDDFVDDDLLGDE